MCKDFIVDPERETHFGYDIDGIFLADYKGSDIKPYLKIRTENLVPIFQPVGKFTLVTGRPVCDRKDVYNWVDTFFTLKPVRICCGMPDLTFDYTKVAQYKAEMIERYNIEVFFESSFDQVSCIRYYLNEMDHNCKIIHWETFINESIHGL